MKQKFCTQKEIEQLHQFCNKHFVRYADVREELVDHLASDIETQWQNNSSISFENALQNCYQKFGVMGFRKVVSEKEKTVFRDHQKLRRNYLLSFIKIPQIFASISITIALFLLLPKSVEHFKIVLLVFGLCTSVFILIREFTLAKRWKKVFVTNKILLLRRIEVGILSPFILISINIRNFIEDETIIGLWFNIFTAIYLFICVILVIYYCYLLPRHIEQIVKKQYPQLVK